MSEASKEARLLLAIKAYRENPKLGYRPIARSYRVSETTLRRRINGQLPLSERRPANTKMTELEEKVILERILDLDSRGFAPHLADVEDMANFILKSQGKERVGQHWARRFVQRQPELSTRFNRVYDYQRALCEDPELIGNWFRLVANMQAKYGVHDADWYNFDETGFMMGVIGSTMVVTRADRQGKSKTIQPGNREWATAIICINGEGWTLPPFLVLQGRVHLTSWYTETGLPNDWVIKTTPNGWTDNDTALEWLKHFDQHTKGRTRGPYRILVLDGHKSHESAEFQEYCKANNIITLGLPAHSSHLTQPLDIGCFSPLKRAYSREIELYIKAHINHITKVEFLIAFKTAFVKSITKQNVEAGFRGAGLIPFNPETVISKLDIKLRTPTPPLPLTSTTDTWVSQTPKNPFEALSQSTLVKGQIARHQSSSPTPIFQTVVALAKGTERLAYELTLANAEIRTLRAANEALSKRRRAKKKQIRTEQALIVEDATDLVVQREANKKVRRDEAILRGTQKIRQSSERRCGTCGKSGHNSRTCTIEVEVVYSSEEDDF